MAGSENKYALETTTKEYLTKIIEVARSNDLRFDDYQKECVVNAIRAIDPMIATSKYTWNNFQKNNIETVLNQVAFLGLNASATPRECYFIIRNTKNPTTNEWYPMIEFGVEGAGNDVILKEFGNVDRVLGKIVYEGDDYVEGYQDGWEFKLPKHTRRFKTTKPILCYYLLKDKQGNNDVVYATLDDVKKSLLGHVRQNGADEELINEMSKHTLDELLDLDGKYATMKLTKTRKVKNKKGYWEEETYETPLISPAWTSPVSRDNMIERKLRNHATRKYPKTFRSPYIQEKYEQTFDEQYERKNVVETTAEEHVDNIQIDIDKASGKKDLFASDDNNESNDNDNNNQNHEPTYQGGKELVIDDNEEYDESEVEDNEDDNNDYDPSNEPPQEVVSQKKESPKPQQEKTTTTTTTSTPSDSSKRKPMFNLPKK